MIEDILAEMALAGFVVSNTFQQPGDERSPPRWDVYLRNTHNTRTGIASGATLEEALRAAVAKANEGGTYERTLKGEAPPRRESPASPPPRVLLGEPPSDSEIDELF